ncbi:MAG: hypothetical protein L0Z51_02495 [Candidatus Latescibacteria bacterium]|nr:hypothetical protein [Candidatus Latescibacterota bacterium]
MLTRARALVLAPVVAVMAAWTPASANVRSLDPYPVTIRYEPRYSRVAEKVDAITREELPRLMSELGLSQLGPIDIVVTDDARDYDASLTDRLPNWGVAFAILDEQRILVDVQKATRAYNSLDEVVPHELSHLLVRQRVPHAQLPIWFSEGLAQWQAREWSLFDSWQLMQGVWTGSVPHVEDLARQYPTDETRAQDAYRISYAAFTDLFSEVGFTKLPEFLGAVEAGESFALGFSDYWGFTVADYAVYFQDDVEKRYRSKALAFQSGPLFGFAALVFVAVVIRQSIKRRRKFAQLEE